MTDERRLQGRRLEAVVRDRWREPGGIRGLSANLGVSRATIYAWFRGQGAPDTTSLSRLARLLGVSPSVLLADIQGGDPGLHDQIRAVVDQSMDERMLSRAASSWIEPPMAARQLEPPRGATPPARLMGMASVPANPRSPGILDVLGPQSVEWCTADDPVGPVAQRLYAGSFTQLPVRDRDSWIGLVTYETIARWTAARSGRGLGYDEATPVREVLPYAEDANNFQVVGSDASASEIAGLFDRYAADGRVLQAVLVTATGQPAGDLVGIVTAWDLPHVRSRALR